MDPAVLRQKAQQFAKERAIPKLEDGGGDNYADIGGTNPALAENPALIARRDFRVQEAVICSR